MIPQKGKERKVFPVVGVRSVSGKENLRIRTLEVTEVFESSTTFERLLDSVLHRDETVVGNFHCLVESRTPCGRPETLLCLLHERLHKVFLVPEPGFQLKTKKFVHQKKVDLVYFFGFQSECPLPLFGVRSGSSWDGLRSPQREGGGLSPT